MKKKCTFKNCLFQKNISTQLCWSCIGGLIVGIVLVWAFWGYLPLKEYVPVAPGSEAAAYNWKYCRVESGRTNVNNTSKDVTLVTPITDLSQAFVLYDVTGDSGAVNAEAHTAIGYISDANTLTFERYGSADRARISYHLIECFDNQFTVQHVQQTIGSADTTETAAISSVSSGDTMVIVNGAVDNATPDPRGALFTGEILDSTTVQFERAVSGDEAKVAAEVIEFTSDARVSLQTGEITLGSGSASTAAAISEVNYDSSWVYCSFDAAANGLRQTTVGCGLTDSETVTVDRGVAGAYTNRVRYYVVEFPESVKVQHGVDQVDPNGVDDDRYNTNISMDEVNDLEKSFSYLTNTTRGETTDYPRNQWYSFIRNNISQVRSSFWRPDAGTDDEARLYWQTIEFLPVSTSAFGLGETVAPIDFPSLTSLEINEGENCTASRTVNVTLEANETIEVLLSNDSIFATGDWLAFESPMTVQWELPAGDGPHTVYALFRSVAMNQSTPVYQTVILDEAGGCE